ncbi:EpsG family protein [Oceanobacillus longus]|uniref:EpsG family protein n=1 Tax=Oceanobacillus longus TaxID=930120 RepID=A0ABV8GZW7_9BACI
MDLIPYFIVLISLTLFLTLARRNVITNNNIQGIVLKKYSLVGMISIIISYLIFTSFSVFRVIEFGLGGNDAHNYKLIFNNANGNVIESLSIQPYEPGYALIIWLSRAISEDYRVALFIIYSIMFIFLINFIKYISWSKYVPISIFLLLTMWLSSFNTLRVILAIFIGTYVYSLLFKKKYNYALLVAIIATTIHTAAIVLFPVIAIVKIIENRAKFRPSKLIFFIIILSGIFLLSINIIEVFISGTSYELYIEYKEGAVALGTYIVIIISFVLSLIKFNDLVEINPYNKILVVILPIGLSLYVLQANFSIVYRMVLFFLPILYVLIPDLIRTFRINRTKELIKLPIKIGLFSYLIYRIYSFWAIEIDSVGVPYIIDF